MLLSASGGNHQHDYYELLRWSVFGYSLFIAYLLYSFGERRVLAAMLFVALIYNPFFEPKLEREKWSLVNFLTLVPFAISLPPLILRRKHP
jgi:hypothetical protein